MESLSSSTSDTGSRSIELSCPVERWDTGSKARMVSSSVAEQVETDRLVRARRKDVDHPAADGELAAFADGRGALVAVDGEVALETSKVDFLPGLGCIAGLAQDRPRRHALHQGVRRGDKHARSLPVALGQPRQRRHPARCDAR